MLYCDMTVRCRVLAGALGLWLHSLAQRIFTLKEKVLATFSVLSHLAP
jgi:hypothetical protein